MRKWIIVGVALLTLPMAAGCSGSEGKAPATASAPPVATIQPTVLTSVQSAATTSTSTGKPAATPAVTGSPKASATPPVAKPSAKPTGGTLTPAAAKGVIEARAQEAVNALKSKDWAALEKLVHPDRGMRLSPYCYVDAKKDIVFPKGQIAKLAGDTTPKVWGTYDGSGEPIQLTFAQFYDKFLYNHDYAKPEKTGYNESYGKSNTKNNIRELYPDSIIVEHYFSGFDPKLEGMDWGSLSLVFESKGGVWYLTGLVHSQWTV